MKKLSDVEKKELLMAVARTRGISKRMTSDEELHKAREKMFKIYENRFRVK